jgi:AcrR family transcriptional regulator
MPKLWNETIEAHRREVRNVILDATATLVAEQGLRSITMGQIAEATGIGRATLYKYYPGVEEILVAWHERQIGRHFEQLVAARNQAASAGDQLGAVLEAYALIIHEHHDGELAALLHGGSHAARAERRLIHFLRDLITAAAQTGAVRTDVPPGELASYCLHALAAVRDLASQAAVRRLVKVTLSGLRPGA